MNRILIGTPAYGGMVTTHYAGSLADTMQTLNEFHHISVRMLSNESLIPRGRNKIASWIRGRGFTHLLFIDADLAWRPEHIEKLLDAKKPLIGGTYPVKKLPVKLNHNALPNAKREGALEEVRHLATGFMLIDVRVLEALEPAVNRLNKVDLTTGATEPYWEYFRSGIYQGEDLSEDWYFSQLARANGITPWLHTEVVLPHIGTFEYKVEE